MKHAFRRLGPAGIAALALAVPATSSAAVRVVNVGPPPSTKKLVQKLGAAGVAKYKPDVNAFFNQHTTIHVGDKVSFINNGFHTIDIPAKGGSDLPLILPSGGLVSGVNDASGTPFWFDGRLPNLGFNPLLFKASGPKSYNGSQRIDSGLPLGPKIKPLVVSFTKAGTYRYFCDVHPGMIGYITVKPKTAKVPTAKQAAAAALHQLTTDIKAAVKAAKTHVPANTVDLGQSAPGGVELYSMFPATLTVNAGTVVTFQMSQHTEEVHTATFGPQSELKTLSVGPAVPPQAAFPSDPGQLVENPTVHGDGFANTGFLDRDASTKTIPAAGKVLFNTPGTYQFVCLIHPFMHGTIVVK
ncbi:MAG TPA: hypothetical protein VFN55_13895 [Solirubrobacteraceae bacterium]|nr:hypothetical protein [Solirubrobacteraceae bacterium]